MNLTPPDEADRLEALAALPPISLATTVSLHLPPERVIPLLGAVEHTLSAPGKTPVVHILSAYRDEGASQIALEVSVTAAVRGEKRVLLLETGTRSRGGILQLRNQLSGSISHFLKGPKMTRSPFLQVEGTSLFFAAITETGGPENGLSGHHLLAAVMAQLRGMFDLVIVHSESALTSSCIADFSTVVDGAVIVVEAERTRIPVIRELKDMIEGSGGHVVGSVLNRRRRYITPWIYNRLFRS